MPKAIRSHFQKSVALVDEPDIALRHFARLVKDLSQLAVNDRSRLRVARQLYIAAWVLFVWARDIDNLKSPYQASELVLLHIWNLVRPHIGRKSITDKAIFSVLNDAIQLHIAIASELLERKILPHVGVRDGISTAIQTRASVDVNLKLFDILGRIALTALWVHWSSQRDPDVTKRAAAQKGAIELATRGFQFIENNRALFLPLQDQQGIEIAMFLLLVGAVDANKHDAHSWLREMVQRLALAVQTHGRYPCVFSDYRDLVAHPRERTDDYRKEATTGSILIPIIAAFLSAFNNQEALATLVDLKSKELEHCTLQVWLPDKSSEDRIYVGSHDHGVALVDVPLSTTGEELLARIREACK